MVLKTRQDYLDSLRKMRPNIYKFGELIEDVTTHPATKRVVESHSRGYDGAHNSEKVELYTTASSFTGQKIHRFTSLMESGQDVILNAKFKRACYREIGTCTGGHCVGWNAFNILWAVTHEIDGQFNTVYQSRLKQWLLQAQENGWAVAAALTDAKGDRSLKPYQQSDLDTNVRVTEVRADGIVIRGAKVMIAGVAASHEIFVLPGLIYGESDKDFVVSCVVPRDVDGLTIVEATRPSDHRELEEGFDMPETGITQGYLFFEDVFVPNERVFMCGEYQLTSKLIKYFTANYRACIGACVAGQGDIMVGAATIMGRANGLADKAFASKLEDMIINNEVNYGLGVGAIAEGEMHPAGVWIADSLLAHTNKVMVGKLPYDTKRICQDISGGIAETGCLPSYKDFVSLEYGHLVKKYLKAGNASAETRARAARLVEWLTLGAGVSGCMHGGGSPDGARLVVRASTPLEDYVNYARKVAGIEEEVPAKPKNK